MNRDVVNDVGDSDRVARFEQDLILTLSENEKKKSFHSFIITNRSEKKKPGSMLDSVSSKNYGTWGTHRISALLSMHIVALRPDALLHSDHSSTQALNPAAISSYCY